MFSQASVILFMWGWGRRWLGCTLHTSWLRSHGRVPPIPDIIPGHLPPPTPHETLDLGTYPLPQTSDMGTHLSLPHLVVVTE